MAVELAFVFAPKKKLKLQAIYYDSYYSVYIDLQYAFLFLFFIF